MEEINVVMVLYGGNQCCDGFVWSSGTERVTITDYPRVMLRAVREVKPVHQLDTNLSLDHLGVPAVLARASKIVVA